MNVNIALLAGDGISPEIIAQAVKALDHVARKYAHNFTYREALVGACAIDATGDPYPEETHKICREADAVLFGAIGDPKYDNNPKAKVRPEQGLLRMRKALGLFANLRPALLFEQLADASPLKPEILAGGLDIVVVRELTGGIYFGEKGFKDTDLGPAAYDVEQYAEEEVRRIAKVAFDMAMKRSKHVTSVDKANVLTNSLLWRETMIEVSKDYPDVELLHMYVDNAAMQLVRNPRQFDVLVTENLFGDILSDEMAMICGSLGMLPSASLCQGAQDNGLFFGLYEPSGGSAPDIAGKGIANPIAQILSLSMLLRYSLGEKTAADAIDSAVRRVIDQGCRTGDLATGAPGEIRVNTAEMGDAIIAAL